MAISLERLKKMLIQVNKEKGGCYHTDLWCLDNNGEPYSVTMKGAYISKVGPWDNQEHVMMWDQPSRHRYYIPLECLFLTENGAMTSLADGARKK